MRFSLPGDRSARLWVIGGTLLSLAVALVAARKYGPLAAGGVLLGVAGLLALLASGRAAVLFVVGLGALAEADPNWGISLPSKLYQHVPSPYEALEAMALLAVLVHLVHRGIAPRLPRPLPAILALLAVALLAGILTGLDAGVTTRSTYVSVLQTVSPLLVVPVLIVNTVRSRQGLRQAILIFLALAGVKAVMGLFVVITGLAPVNVGLGRITYYNPAGNMICALFLLTALAARLSGMRPPRWVWALTPLVFACLLLSYRRSFWLGTALSAALLLAPASGRIGRRLLVPALVAFGLVVYLALGTGITGDLQGGVASRVASINIGSIERNQQDRYRIDERKNVWAAVSRDPITGIGLGTPWVTRSPMGLEFPDGHLYSHLGVLWWWMKMGLLGLAAYLLLIGSAVVTGIRVWLRHPDALIRVFGLAAAAFSVGMAVVELTATLIGADERASLIWAAMLGMLAVAGAQLKEAKGIRRA